MHMAVKAIFRESVISMHTISVQVPGVKLEEELVNDFGTKNELLAFGLWLLAFWHTGTACRTHFRHRRRDPDVRPKE
jgi:hypothetical protein